MHYKIHVFGLIKLGTTPRYAGKLEWDSSLFDEVSLEWRKIIPELYSFNGIMVPISPGKKLLSR